MAVVVQYQGALVSLIYTNTRKIHVTCHYVAYDTLDLCGGYNYESTSIWPPFDGSSSANQISAMSQWRNPLAAVTVTYLFI